MKKPIKLKTALLLAVAVNSTYATEEKCFPPTENLETIVEVLTCFQNVIVKLQSEIGKLKGENQELRSQLKALGAGSVYSLYTDKPIHAPAITTNNNPQGWEHNLLFNAHKRFKVTQSGPATFNFSILFDGRMNPQHPLGIPTPNNPHEILIENLPGKHIQNGAWVGWTTRAWPVEHFKIEGYNVYPNSAQNTWIKLADYENRGYYGGDFTVRTHSGSYTKLRFTFYRGRGPDGQMGLSELFFIHPEAVRPYEGLLQTQEYSEPK